MFKCKMELCRVYPVSPVYCQATAEATETQDTKHGSKLFRHILKQLIWMHLAILIKRFMVWFYSGGGVHV